MINPTTLILATLVFQVASVFGAPVPYVAKDLSPHLNLTFLHRIAPAQAVAPVASAAATLPREVVADVVQPVQRSADELNARDAAPLAPQASNIPRTFPRGILYDLYVVKRSATPAPDAPSAHEPPVRRFPRGVLYDKYNKRANVEEPKLEARSEPEIVARRFPRRVLAERFAQTASTPVTREVVEEDVHARSEGEQPPTATPSATTTTLAGAPTPTGLGDIGVAIAAAVANSSPSVINKVDGPNGNTSTWSQSKVEIIITHSGNRKVELAVDNKRVPVPSSSTATPTATSSPTSTASPTATSTATSTDAPTSTATPAEGQPPAEEKPPAGEEQPPTEGTPEGGETPAERRDVVDGDAVSAQPIVKRGLSGALLATWARRNL